MRPRILLACSLALACGRGAHLAAPAADASDGGIAQTSDAGSSAAPDAGDLSVLTCAPISPRVVAVCDGSSLTPAPPGHHPGPCAIVGLQKWETAENIFTVKRTYQGSAVATEQRENWGSSLPPDSRYAEYQRTITENSYDSAVRLKDSIKRDWLLAPSCVECSYSLWERTDYSYGTAAFSTTTVATRRWGDSPPGPPYAPVPIDIAEYVVDALGKVIRTRDYHVEERVETDTAVTFHLNGSEKSESWSGFFRSTNAGQTIVFDDAGNPLRDDRFAGHPDGRGMNRWQVTYSYGGGRLAERRTEYSWHSGWIGDPLGQAAVTVETYRYDAGRLAVIDSIENDEQCNFVFDGQVWVSANCAWKAGPERHTSFRYDAFGNLIDRTVIDGAGKELSRWTGVSDRDANLLCELQTEAGAVTNFSHYDYSCW
jgi:hypothetical protein